MRTLPGFVAALLATGLTATALATPGLAAAGPASPESMASPESTTSRAAVAKTRIVVRAPDCEGCEITAMSQRRITKYPGYVWPHWSATVTDGSAVFVIPRARTRWLHFIFDEQSIPGVTGGLGAAPVAVMRYQGMKPGQKVSPTRAARSRQATGCWAGTTKARVRLDLKVDHFRARDAYRSEKVTMARLYFTPTQPSLGTLKHAPFGTTGTQDAFTYCSY